MAEQRQENNKPTKRTIEIWGRRSLPGTMRQTTKSHAYSFRKAIFAPAPRWWVLTRFSRSFPNWTVLGKKESKVAWSGCSRSLVLEKGVPEFADFLLLCVCFNGRNVGKALCGAKNPAEMRTTPTTVKSTSKWAILPNYCRITWSGLHSPFVFEKKKSKKSNFVLLCTKWSG